MSRTIKFARAGGPEVLEFIEVEAPSPGPHEVRIKVKAIGINRADSMWRKIVNYAGATPIALTRTSEKKQRLHDAGAQHVIATQEQDLLAEVMRITDGNGARVAFEPVGGSDFAKLVAALTFQGIAYIYGALSEDDATIPVLEMIRKMTVVKGYSVRLVTGDADRRKAAVEYVTKGLASGALKPVVDRTFKFDEMAEVHRYMENGGQFGKIVVTL
jgi:NADPH:quinone reductase-like Zn-dependent oxidoreductase